MNYLTVLLLVATASAMLPESASAGSPELRILCEDGLKKSECRVDWKAVRTGGAYWIERFDVATQSWQRTYGPLPDPNGQNVEIGWLYRVASCVDRARADCNASTVFWAPVKPQSPEEIPDTVTHEEEGTMLVSRGLSLVAQTQQYNDYLMVSLLHDIEDIGAMPPMTAPLVDPFAPWASREAMFNALFERSATPDEIIHFVVYQEYEGTRRNPSPD